MPDIDSISSAYYYSGLRTATSKSQKEKETEKTSTKNKVKFSELIKSSSTEETAATSLYPTEIEGLSTEEAAIYLKEEVEKAGNALSSEITLENLEQFKTAIKQFLTYIEKNNYEVETTVVMNRRLRKPVFYSPLPAFSTYQTPPMKKTKTSFTIINEKLDALTREMMSMQRDNIRILAQVEDIKGLIVDILN